VHIWWPQCGDSFSVQPISRRSNIRLIYYMCGTVYLCSLDSEFYLLLGLEMTVCGRPTSTCSMIIYFQWRSF
jgi:hypothetical protein